MQRHQATYAYCSNPQCEYLEVNQEEGFSHSNYTVAIDGSPSIGYCPHCKAIMRSSCPHCHQALISKPFNFCPLCGGAFKIPSVCCDADELHCQICDRLMYDKKHADGPLLCSEKCISIFIKNNIRICDCCGKRFNFQENISKCFINISMREDEHGKLDFCSEQCMDKYMASSAT